MEPSQEQIYRRRIAELEVEVASWKARAAGAEAEVADLKAQVARLAEQVAKLSKNSSNSSKPPSSDIVKPPKPPTPQGKRHIGGQPGHPRHAREPFASNEIDEVRPYRLEQCPDCGSPVQPIERGARVVQQIEILERPVEVVEHRGEACWCPRCQKVHYAPLPVEVEKGGLAGPNLISLIAYLKGVCHASFSTIRKFFRDVLKITVSRGQLAKLIGKASAALAGVYEALRARLPAEPRLNVDETGHKENGKSLWTWCFRAELYTLFRIDPSRGSGVLIEMLGKEFDGVLGCDYFSAYRKYMKEFGIEVQFCLAHLIRDVKFLTTWPEAATRAYAERVLEGLRKLFGVIHRREETTPEAFQRSLEQARGELIATAERAPPGSKAQNLAKRFRLHGDAYFRFITTPGIEPTNNVVEQAMRFVAIDRHITQGTRSERGRRWCERIWTVIATSTQQGRSAFEYLREAITAYLRNQPIPPLIPDGA